MSDFTEKVEKSVVVCDILVLEHHPMPCHRNHSEGQVRPSWCVLTDINLFLGAPMGCAPIAHSLWGSIMNYNPENPKWVSLTWDP